MDTLRSAGHALKTWSRPLQLALLPVLALGAAPLNGWLGGRLGPALAARGWPIAPGDLAELLFFGEAGLLCLASARSSALGLGSWQQWRRHLLAIVGIWSVAPLGVVTLYAHFTAKPFHGMPLSSWLIGSIAQELFFTGFVYGRMEALLGLPESGRRAGLSAPMVLTPLLFSLWHWPNLLVLGPGYMAFQFAYTLVISWMNLHLRRWTGSLWPAAANHVAVNFLASAV